MELVVAQVVRPLSPLPRPSRCSRSIAASRCRASVLALHRSTAVTAVVLSSSPSCVARCVSLDCYQALLSGQSTPRTALPEKLRPETHRGCWKWIALGTVDVVRWMGGTGSRGTVDRAWRSPRSRCLLCMTTGRGLRFQNRKWKALVVKWMSGRRELS